MVMERAIALPLRLKEIITLGIAAVLFGSLFAYGAPEREPIASAETRFVEYSKSGLQIVPASCASAPSDGWFGLLEASFGTVDYEHYPGECSGGESPPGCPEGTVLQNGVCVPITPPPTDVCPGDEGIQTSGPCGGTTDACPNDPGIQASGPCGSTNGCPSGAICVPPNSNGGCLLGYSSQGGTCVFGGCPSGYTFTGGQCVPNGPQCAPFYCVGNQLYENNAQCVGSFVQACAFGCSGGGCLAAPPGTGNITVAPALVRSGETTRVEWTTSDMLANSCFVTENNPDITDSGSGPSGSFVSSSIRQQTSFTLVCQKQDESTFMDSATVNIIPVFEED